MASALFLQSLVRNGNGFSLFIPLDLFMFPIVFRFVTRPLNFSALIFYIDVNNSNNNNKKKNTVKSVYVLRPVCVNNNNKRGFFNCPSLN